MRVPWSRENSSMTDSSGWDGGWFRDVWWAGLRIGGRLLTSSSRLGIRTLYDPVSYWRTAEFAYVVAALKSRPVSGRRIFDLGSPKMLGFLLSDHLKCTFVTCDLWRREVKQVAQYAKSLDSKVTPVQQDGRELSHPSNLFAAATSVSVLEHIPDCGDTEAMSEMVRVVQPGGAIIGTVPYARSHRETWVRGDVYSRKSDGETLFYQRHYNLESFYERLVQDLPVRLADVKIWTEVAPVEYVLRHNLVAKYLSPPVQPLLARAFLRQPTGGQRPDRGALFFTILVS